MIVIKIASIALLLVLAGIVIVHLLPWIVGILAILGLVKLYHLITRPKNPSTPLPLSWPWKE